jgi:hypothetical protein
MNALVTVFKVELEDKPEIKSQLLNLSDETREVSGAFIFSPQSGKLFEFLSILKSHNIGYGTHFNSKI